MLFRHSSLYPAFGEKREAICFNSIRQAKRRTTYVDVFSPFFCFVTFCNKIRTTAFMGKLKKKRRKKKEITCFWEMVLLSMVTHMGVKYFMLNVAKVLFFRFSPFFQLKGRNNCPQSLRLKATSEHDASKSFSAESRQTDSTLK